MICSILDNPDFATSIVIPSISLLITAVSGVVMYLIKGKLEGNSHTFNDKLDKIEENFEAIKVEVKELKVYIDDRKLKASIYDGVNDALQNTLKYVNDHKIGNYVTRIGTDFNIYVSDMIVTDINNWSPNFVLSKLEDFKSRVVGLKYNEEFTPEFLSQLDSIVVKDFSNFETKLLELSVDKINNKNTRFKMLALTFIQDIMSLSLRHYNKKN